MTNKQISEEAKQGLKSSPYVRSVSDTTIKFTEEFKSLFWQEMQNDKTLKDIFRQYGINPDWLSDMRIYSFGSRVKEQAQRPDGFKDLNLSRDRYGVKKKRSRASELKYLRHKVALLEQENDFLKKNEVILQSAKLTGRLSKNSFD